MNALNAPPPPKVEGDTVLTGVTVNVVDMGIPNPVLPNLEPQIVSLFASHL